VILADDVWMGLTGNPDAESLNGRLLFAIPKKGESDKFLQQAAVTEVV
jgi:hypothetical protein